MESAGGVRARREAAGLTVAQLAAAAGCAESTVRRIEAGADGRPALRRRIEAALAAPRPREAPEVPGADELAHLVRVLVGLPPAVRRPVIELLEALRPGRPGFDGLDEGALPGAA